MAINNDGKPVSALIDVKLFGRIRPMQGRFDTLCQRTEAGFSNLPESEGLAEINAAVQLERAQARESSKKH